MPITRDMLINAQQNDTELSEYFQRTQAFPRCFYVKQGILMRKFRPPHVPASEVWLVTHQIVVPSCYRRDVLSLAHDHIGEHLGVNKAYYKILQHFFWPRLKKYVV